ncbi:helix-turn-helix transcriptional regulator [Arhodomonas sp. AD133]|uniref:helix-turn-helix transcriptional regulator n=1 Tax=Arhodomonas sp. AD133 TaxID=3415009 RepID=UPI003EC12D56
MARRGYRLERVRIGAPTLIVVLRGEKTLFYGGQPIVGHSGDWLGLPAGCEMDVINRPEHGLYHALAIPFNASDIAAVRALAQPPAIDRATDIRIHTTPPMWQALVHYAETHADAPPALLAHRRREVLLAALLEEATPQLLIGPGDSTATRVAHLLATDPAAPWCAPDVAQRLAVSEATLRRRLAAEHTSFRERLVEVRLATGLSLLQQGGVSVAEAASRCGYDSPSRFAQRFRERFGTSPSTVSTPTQ